jgi:hypothetical protein
MTTRRKAGTPRKESKKLKLKKKTLKDLEPRSAKDAKGGVFDTLMCMNTLAITCGDCRTLKCATRNCTYKC